MSACPFCSETFSGIAIRSEEPQVRACRACLNPFLLEGEATTPLPGFQDVRESAPPGSIGATLLRGVVEQKEKLPVLPTVSQRTLRLMEEPDHGLEDLIQLVEQDPMLASKVMQMANSAMYGGLSPVADLTTACTRLGEKKLANCLQVAANGTLFITGNRQFRDLMRRHMDHALVTAHCAHEIAVAIAESHPEILFVTGLVHRIGMVPLLNLVAQSRSGALAELREQPALLEDALEGFQPLVGLHVIHDWNVPPTFNAAVFFQNNADSCPGDRQRAMAHIIKLASLIASVSGHDPWGHDVTEMLLAHGSAQFLGLTDVKLACIRVELEDRVAPLLDMAEIA